MVPDLMSFLDTSIMIKDEMAKHAAKIREHTAEYDKLSRRLAARTSSDDSQQSAIAGSAATVSAKKRQRS